jgi:hypothetical protein
VPVGDYPFSLVIDSSSDTYTRNLKAKIKGNYEMKVYPEEYQYPENKDDSRVFTIRVTNGGDAGTLTNVKATVSALDG